MKILVAADGSEYTRRALEYLAANDWLRAGHELAVFTAVPPLPHRAAALAGTDLAHEYYRDDAEQVLRPVRETLAALGVAATFDYVVAHPGEAIARKARDGGFDLIVMGAHGRGAMANLVLGSVATQVLASCKTPTLVIR